MIRFLLLFKALGLFFLLGVPVLLPTDDFGGPGLASRQGLELPGWLTHFAARDEAYYLSVAQEGYQPGEGACAFYPLWPAVLRFFNPLGDAGQTIVALVLTQILSLGALILFHRFAREHCGTEVASSSLILLLAFPSAFFLFVPYSESLFLFLVMLFFTALFQSYLFGICAVGLLLPLTRAVGIFCLAPLAIFVWQKHRAEAKWYSTAVFPVLGYLLYFITHYLATGNALEGFEAQRGFPNSPSIANALDLDGFVGALIRVEGLHDMTGSLIDRAFFVLFLLCLPPLFRMNRVLFGYVLLVGLVPGMTSWFISYTRYLLVCFPLFIVAARFLNHSDDINRNYGFWYLVGILASLQVCFALRHISFSWGG